MVLSLVLTTAVIYIPFLNNAFQFESINFDEYAVAMVLALMMIPLVEMQKLCKRKLAKRREMRR